LLSKQEAERLIAARCKRCVPYRMVAARPIPIIDLPEGSILSGQDGSVSYDVYEETIGLHSLIKLTIGKRGTTRTICILLCLVCPQSRRDLEPLLATTIKPEVGKLNSQNAEVILRDGRRALYVNVPLPGLTTNYVMLQLMPTDFPLRFASPHCPFCKDLLDQEAIPQ
jgi:hypothetical protein